MSEKYKKPEFIEISPSHTISTKGIMAIKQRPDCIEVRYMRGYTERINNMSMMELLDKLGRNPMTQGRTDSP